MWAGIVGAKGRAKLGGATGSSTTTPTSAAGRTYVYLAGRGGHRVRVPVGRSAPRLPVLYYSQSGQDKLIDNISFGGFALGVNFRF